MGLDGWNSDNKLKLTIDGDKLGELLLQGNSTDSAQCSASSSFSSSYYPVEAWDGIYGGNNTVNAWINNGGTNPANPDGSCYIQWNFGAAKSIHSMRFHTRGDGGQDAWPSNIKILVSTTGVFSGEEATLYDDDVPGASSMSPDEWSVWMPFTNYGSYQYLRMEIHERYVYQAGGTWFAIQEVEFKQGLANFPVLIALASNSGQGDLDTTCVFDELEPNTVAGTAVSGTYDSYTKLMLHMDGDFSDSQHTITVANGNPQSTASGVFNGSMYFDGTGDCLSTPDSTDWTFGNDPFTIELWCYRTASADQVVISQWDSSGGTRSWALYLLVGNTFKFFWGSTSTYWVTGTIDVPIYTWTHVAVVKDATNTRMYVNGVEDGTQTSSSIVDSALDLIVGAQVSGDHFHGYIDEVRVSKDVARWTTSFSGSLPSEPYTTDSYTKLLLHFDGDQSDSQHAFTFNGDPQIYSSEGKFNGSYCFDGIGDYLQLDDSVDWDFGTGDFTIDWWMYKTATFGVGKDIFSSNRLGGTSWLIHPTSSIFHFYHNGSSIFSPSYTELVSIWQHWALVRQGDNMYLFLDGIQQGSTSTGHVARSIDGSVYLRIGGDSVNPSVYMDEIRISKGVARWTSNFTVPIGPYGSSWDNRKKIAVTTTVSGVETELYVEIDRWDTLNEQAWLWTKVPTLSSGTDAELYLYYDFTHADNVYALGNLCIHSNDADGSTTFIDSSFSNHTISYTGDVHHETDQAKFGISSIYFDGTGDYLSIPDSDDWTFGTEDFTIDFWIKRGRTLTREMVWGQCEVGGSGTSVSIRMEIGADDQLHFYLINADRITGYYLNDTDWHHILVERDGTYLSLFVDGILEYTVSIGSVALINSTTPWGIGRQGDYDGLYFQGYIDEYRILKGTALFVSNFIPPISQYTIGHVGDTGETPAQNVWDDHFAGVWHCSQSPTGVTDDIWDSTISGHPGTSQAALTSDDWVDGKIGKSYQFASGGVTDRIDIEDSTDFSFGTDGFTIEYIVKPTSGGGTVFANYETVNLLHASYFDSSTSARVLVGGSDRITGMVFTADVFQYYVLVREIDNVKAYVNDVQQGNTWDATGVSVGQDTKNYIGATDSLPHTFDGDVDEVRISTIGRSAEWRKATYYSNWDDLITFESEWLYGWGNRLSFTIDKDKIDSDLTNFPVMINISALAGQTGSNISSVFNELESDANRKKIAITTASDGAELFIEIEQWDDANEQAWLWAKVPTIVSGTDTELYLYYDKTHSDNTDYVGDTGDVPAQNVWDDDFVMVHHMSIDPSSTMTDSTSNGHNLTLYNMDSGNLIDGPIAKTMSFNGTDEHMQTADHADFDINTYTVETILNIPSGGSAHTICHHGDATVGGQQGIESVVDSTGEVGIQYFNGSWMFPKSTGTITYNQNTYIVTSVDASYLNVYFDGAPETPVSLPAALTDTTYPMYVGVRKSTTLINYMTTVVEELRYSKITRSDAWIKATYYSNWDNLIYYGSVVVVFTFSNPTPVHLSTVYGTSHTLQLTTTISGGCPNYVYDAIFYDACDDSQIGSTVSGTNSGQVAYIVMQTPSGTDYSWYLVATSSGQGDTSSTYTFTNRFLCSGTTEINSVLTEGISVRLYRRSDGMLIGSTASISGGLFEIESTYNESHYAIAMHPTDSGTNALIYDWLTP